MSDYVRIGADCDLLQTHCLLFNGVVKSQSAPVFQLAQIHLDVVLLAVVHEWDRALRLRYSFCTGFG